MSGRLNNTRVGPHYAVWGMGERLFGMAARNEEPATTGVVQAMIVRRITIMPIGAPTCRQT